MESFKIENVSFAYPHAAENVLDSVSLTVNKGEFLSICGFSGCGKTTLLRLLKPSLSPVGEKSGTIRFKEKRLEELSEREQASFIGFVSQNPETQIVTDKVWHELAFGLENLGMPTEEIRRRVAEMASFFGIQAWFHKKTSDLSGGQKQLLNLAAVMVMQPSVLILDEPTSLLDPIAAEEFIKTLEKINKELGTTVILSEHRLDHIFSVSDRIAVLDNGKIFACGTPKAVCLQLKKTHHGMFLALPEPAFIYGLAEESENFPLSVREGREWIEKYAKNHALNEKMIPKAPKEPDGTVAVEMKDIWFRYEKNAPDVLKNVNLKIKQGEIFVILGGNGTGKSTALSLIAGLNVPHRGEILINGEKINAANGILPSGVVLLPQNPKNVFVKKTVYLDLLEMTDEKESRERRQEHILSVAQLCRIENLLNRHPFDLSGGEQQRAALAKVLLKSPEILLLDEPTKGMDAKFKGVFADILRTLKQSGVTVVMVSHDVSFCAAYADCCAMFFDGGVTSTGHPRAFFAGNTFYTTAANRMTRGIIKNAILASDVVAACGKAMIEHEPKTTIVPIVKKTEATPTEEKKQKLSAMRITLGILFVAAFLTVIAAQLKGYFASYQIGLQILSVVLLFGALKCLILPNNRIGAGQVQQPKNRRKFKKSVGLSLLSVLVAVPLTLYVGIFYLGDRKYYFISLLILLEIFVPLCAAFEAKKPSAREITVIAVLCAIAVAGRSAFYMLPQFKPVGAVVIIAGVCLGAESGFLVGAMTGFVSNFFFGQGPWTPWQMFAFGILGFAAGLLYKKGFLRKTKESLSLFGFLSTLLLYGVIMNSSFVIQSQTNLNFSMFAASIASGFPFDLVHAISCAFFLWFLTEPLIEKTERVKEKYGLFCD